MQLTARAGANLKYKQFAHKLCTFYSSTSYSVSYLKCVRMTFISCKSKHTSHFTLHEAELQVFSLSTKAILNFFEPVSISICRFEIPHLINASYGCPSLSHGKDGQPHTSYTIEAITSIRSSSREGT